MHKLLVLLLSLMPSLAAAAYITLPDEHFDSPASETQIPLIYPDGNLQLFAARRLQLTSTVNATTQQCFGYTANADALWITALPGRFDALPGCNVTIGLGGFGFGGKRIILHPGLDAIRVSGSDGFSNLSADRIGTVEQHAIKTPSTGLIGPHRLS